MNTSNVQPLPPSTKTLPFVRPAVMGDYSDLMAMCYEVYEENGLGKLDEDMLKAEIVNALGGQRAIFGVIGPVGQLEAAIHLSFSTFWYSRDVHLAELWAFVRPEYRKSRNAQALLEFAKNLSVNLGVPLFIGVLSNIRTQAKVRMYRRKLGEPRGAYFMYNVPAEDG